MSEKNSVETAPAELPAAAIPGEAAASLAPVAAEPESTTESPAERQPQAPPVGRRLRRMLDADIEDELQAAFAQFDGAALMAGPTPATMAPSAPAATPAGPKTDKQTVRVLSVRGDAVFVELGEKSEGMVPIHQFEGKIPRVGDAIEVVPDHYDAGDDLMIFRRPGAAQEAEWGNVEKGMVVDAQVKKVNKGGLEVSVSGMRGFMPAGQVDLDHIPDLSIFVGHTLRCLVSEVSLSERNLIVSRKAVLERERGERGRETLASLAEGQVRDGIVKRIADFGAFVDIGGVDGLLHISQMSWRRVQHPSELLAVGQEVKVSVVSIDREKGKIGLGLKQLAPSPWALAEEKYHAGIVVPGTVTKLMEFGAFVELEPGIEGLIHISELSRTRVRRVADIVQPGQSVEVKILDFDRERKRIGLSLKQALPEEPLPELQTEHPAEEAPPAVVKKRTQPLKGGLGSTSGPLF